jgi:phospholipid/cholesterol/gamma-HCH transport system substrate-binding protein
VKLAIQKHWLDFVAIIGLVVIAALGSIYILDHQRLKLPGWVPLVGKDFFVIKAEMSTAQAVTPGQGQTVNIAGVQVGEISKVELKDGKALVTLRMEPRYGRVYKDATVLLRPKTGLKDMVAELEPGHASAGRVEEGGVIPVGQTLPDVNLDEILAALAGDTRDYLTVLLGAGAEGLRGNGRELANALRRLEPSARYGRKVFASLAKRRQNLKRVIHNLSLVMDELGAKDDQLAEFVENSNAVFASLSSQDANLRATLSELPSSLQATQEGVGKTKTLADELGPTLQALRPGARALGPTLKQVRPFVKETLAPLRDEIRPFVRASRPTVRELRPAARDLAAAAPDLDRSFSVVKQLLDMLASNPPGKEEG